MKSILLILPYFGKFPSYFQLFLKSCGRNPSIDWLIITDQKQSDYLIPQNVKWIKESFTSICHKIELLFGVSPINPYSLCKYRVAYHRIFDSFVRDYDFWGYCDCDLIFGDIRSFLTKKILNEYAKISWRGHLTLFKNQEPYNSAYLSEIPGIKTFEGCINGTDGLNLFDEVGINKIFDYFGYKIYTELPFCDLKIRSNNFICNHDIFDRESNVDQIFRWDLGHLYRIFAKDKKVLRQEVVYVHFLKREMFNSNCIPADADSFLMVPNKFIPDAYIDYKQLMKLSKKRFYTHYWLKRFTPKFILNKLLHKIKDTSHEVDQYFPPK